MPPTYRREARAGEVEDPRLGVARELVTDRDHAAGGDLQRAELRIALGLAGLEIVAPHRVELLRVEEDRQPAVGVLGGVLDRLAHQARPEDRDVLAHRVVDDLQRLAQSRSLTLGERHLDGRAVVDDLLALPRHPADVDVVADARHRLLVRHAVEALDHLRAGCAEPEDEPPVRHEVEAGRGLRHARCGTGEHVEDARPDLDRVGLGGQIPHL